MGSCLRWLLLTVLLYGAVAENIVQRHRQLQRQAVKVSTAATNRILFITANTADGASLKADDPTKVDPTKPPSTAGKIVQALTQNVAFSQFNYMFVAIALQEVTAYKCDGGLIAADVLTLVNQASMAMGGDTDQYMLAGYSFTGGLCSKSGHGGSGVLVFAHKDLKLPAALATVTDQVSHSTMNSEKATTIARVKYGGFTFCFAGSHFVPSSPADRAKNFGEAVRKGNLLSCDLTLWGGDFNFRTAANGLDSSTPIWTALANKMKDASQRDASLSDPLQLDEFAGGSRWDAAFADCRGPNKPCDGWSEAEIKFLPSYSIIKSSELDLTNAKCMTLDDTQGPGSHGKQLCYRADRPMSWTDRVVYRIKPTLAMDPTSVQYDSVLDASPHDHAPIRFECSVTSTRPVPLQLPAPAQPVCDTYFADPISVVKSANGDLTTHDRSVTQVGNNLFISKNVGTAPIPLDQLTGLTVTRLNPNADGIVNRKLAIRMTFEKGQSWEWLEVRAVDEDAYQLLKFMTCNSEAAKAAIANLNWFVL